MINLRRVYSLGVLSLGALGACHRVEHSAPGSGAPPPSSTGWVVAEENDTLRVSVDTTGWDRGSPRAVLWIAINDVSTPERRTSSSPFFRFETRQEVDCASGRARGFDIRTPDSTGTLAVHPVRDSTWRPFATARLPAAVLLAVCTKLAELRR